MVEVGFMLCSSPRQTAQKNMFPLRKKFLSPNKCWDLHGLAVVRDVGDDGRANIFHAHMKMSFACTPVKRQWESLPAFQQVSSVIVVNVEAKQLPRLGEVHRRNHALRHLDSLSYSNAEYIWCFRTVLRQTPPKTLNLSKRSTYATQSPERTRSRPPNHMHTELDPVHTRVCYGYAYHRVEKRK